jgi:transketolase
MPSTDQFDRQDPGYRESVLPRAVVARVAIEAGATALWWKYVGSAGRVIGIDRFGASGKAPELFRYFGFTADAVRQAVLETLNSVG